MNFWHMQLHQDKKHHLTDEQIMSILNDYGRIGMSRRWKNDGKQPDHFRSDMQIGDIVAIRSGKKPIALVEITGDCVDNPEKNDLFWFDIVRPIRILSTTPLQMPVNKYFTTYIKTLVKEKFNVYVHSWYASLSSTDSNTNLLLKSHNLVFTGAPGTGKTYLAKQIALEITGDTDDTPADARHWDFVQFHPSFDYTDFVEGLRPTPIDSNGNIGFKRQDGIFKAFCKRALQDNVSNEQDNFEESWEKLIDYLKKDKTIKVYLPSRKRDMMIELTQNVEGLVDRKDGSKRPSYITKEDMLKTREWVATHDYPGPESRCKLILKKMQRDFGLKEYKIKEAPLPKKQNYVFIIDEINRGDIAKIFGELFFSIDPGYRGPEGRIKTQYSNLIEKDDPFYEGFYVPENIYIIGTMNDIDRNVESMDFAIRRRFSWKTVTAEDTMNAILGSSLGPAMAEEAKQRMIQLNNRISTTKELGESYCIGGAYFAKLKECNNNWQDLWAYYLKPLLDEYVRGLVDAENLMESFKSIILQK